MAFLQKDSLFRALGAVLLVAFVVVQAGVLSAQGQSQLPPLTERVKMHEALRLLTKLGYDEGTVDATMKTGIQDAVREYQRVNALPVDGKVTDSLLASLRTAKQ